MKKYQILNTEHVFAAGDRICTQIHLSKEFDSIAEAVSYIDKYKGTATLILLKTVTWRTEITDISEVSPAEEQ